MKLPRVPPHIRNTTTYLGAIALTQLASFVLLPIITRFMGPEKYGEYALALAVSALVGTVASSWIRNVAFRFYFDAKEAATTRSFYLSLALLQAAVGIAAFGIAGLLLAFRGETFVPTATLMAAAGMVLAGDFQALTTSFIRAEQDSGRYAAAEVTAAVTRLVGTASGLALGLTEPAFLFLAAMGASLVGSAIGLRSLWRSLLGPSRISGARMVEVLKRLPGALPFSLGEWLGTLSDRLILNIFASTAVVGIYAAGHSLGDRIIGGLVMAVFMMAWPDVLQAFSDGGYERARVAIRRYFQIYLWLTTGPLVALLVFGQAAVSILGDAYQAAASVIGLVAGAAWLRGLNNGFNRHFELQKRFWPLSAITVGGAAINLILNFIFVPRYLAVGAGLAALTSQAVVCAVYVALRDRRLVWFPGSELLLVFVSCAILSVGAMMLFGQSLLALVVFAGGYLLAMGGVMGRRLLEHRG